MELCKRKDVPVEQTWDLSLIFSTEQQMWEALEALKGCDDILMTAEAIRDDVIPKMEHLRKHVDEAEMLTSEKCWPFPSYGKLLFSVY